MFIQKPLKPVLRLFAFRQDIVLKGIVAFALALFVLILVNFGGWFNNTAHAATPTINFQARLESSDGAIAPDGVYNVEFKIYQGGTESGGGTLVWTGDHLVSASQGIRVANGYLSANLGSITNFSTSINWDANLYLSMNIGGTGPTASWDGEMTPYLKLTAVPYAMQAQSATQLQADSGGFSGTLQFGALTADESITVPQSTAATDTVCLQTLGNCTNASGVTTVGALDTAGYDTSVDGATINGTTIYLQSATDSVPGLVNTGNQIFGGNKTFSNDLYVQGRVGIGLTSPAYPLDVVGDINSTTGYRLGGDYILQAPGTNNLFVGIGAGSASVTGTSNTLVGYNAGNGLTTGSGNLAFGSNALAANSIGSNNLAFGRDSQRAGTGSYNTSVGTSSLYNVSGNSNIAVGYNALNALTSGGNNVAIGTNAGSTLTTGTGNVFIGYHAGQNATGSDQLIIANSSTSTPLIQGDFNAGALTINGSQTVTGEIISGTSTTAGSLVLQDGIGHTVSLTSAAQTNSIALTIPVDTNLTDEVCLKNLANCVGGGTGTGDAVGGGGTQNKIAVFTDSGTIGDSQIWDDGTSVGIGIQPVQDLYKLNVNGSVNATAYYLNGTQLCDTTGCTPQGGSGSYIQNTDGTATQQANASFNIDGDGTVGGTLTATDASVSGTLQMGTATNGGTFTSGGGLIFTGSARHTKRIRLAPEYANMVLDPGDGPTGHIGIMTTGYNVTDAKMYYNWTTHQTTNQNYDMVVQIPLPEDFDGFTGTLNIDTYTSDITNGTIELGLRDSTNTQVINFASITPTATDTWQTQTVTIPAGTYTAGQYIILRIRMQSPQDGAVRVGNIFMDYKAKF